MKKGLYFSHQQRPKTYNIVWSIKSAEKFLCYSLVLIYTFCSRIHTTCSTFPHMCNRLHPRSLTGFHTHQHTHTHSHTHGHTIGISSSFRKTMGWLNLCSRVFDDAITSRKIVNYLSNYSIINKSHHKSSAELELCE